MNHCFLQVEVSQPPTIRYTQDNQTPIAEMEVNIDGLRPDDPKATLKAIGWGGLAQQLQNEVQVGQSLILEGRLRMNTLTRPDGTKEKKAEITISKFHQISINQSPDSAPEKLNDPSLSKPQGQSKDERLDQDSSNISSSWNSAPLVPDDDEIPF